MHSVVRAPSTVRAAKNAEAIAVLRRSALSLMDRLPSLTDRVVVLIQKQEPAYRSPALDPDGLWQEVHRSLQHNVGSLLRPGELREPARRCTWRIGADRAEQGLPLDALLHAFRIGGGAVWEDLLETAARLDPEGMRLLVHVAADVWNFVDEHCSLAADAYRKTERQLAWRRANRLRLMTDALLGGTTRISDLPEIAAALDLPEQGRYAVAVVTGDGTGPRPVPSAEPATEPSGEPVGEPGGDACPASQTAFQTVAGPEGGRSSGGIRVRWHATPEADFAIALLGPDGGPEDLVGALGPLSGRRVGVSSAVDGLAAVGEARRLAETALRSRPVAGDEVVLLHDHLPAALLVCSPELGAALTERVLGPVLRLEHTDRDLLLQTLTAWLECDESAQRAAARLCCHRNTVLNRLRRYERLTGRSLGRPREMVELSLALQARTLLSA